MLFLDFILPASLPPPPPLPQMLKPGLAEGNPFELWFSCRFNGDFTFWATSVLLGTGTGMCLWERPFEQPQESSHTLGHSVFFTRSLRCPISQPLPMLCPPPGGLLPLLRVNVQCPHPIVFSLCCVNSPLAISRLEEEMDR